MWILYGGGKKQWTVLRHNGPFFPEEYKKHNIPIIYNNNEIILPDLAEEYATLYARYLDTEYVNNIKFNKNFFNDFKKVLPKELKIDDIYQIDFSLIKKHLDKLSEAKKV